MAESLRAALEERARRHPQRLAVRFGDFRQTYGELNASIDRTANALARLDVGVGSRVAVMLPNRPEMLWTWLALAKLGATFVPVNVHLKGDGLRYLLSHAEPTHLVADGGTVDGMRSCAAGLDGVQARILVGGAAAQEDSIWSDFGTLTASATDCPPTDPGPLHDGLAAIMYTSGTTGRPKGVMIGRAAQYQHGLNYSGLLDIREHETAYAYLPLFHVTAMGTTLGSLLAGANVAIDDGFSPFGFWERTREYGASVFTFVGSVLTLLFNRPERTDDADNPVRRVVGAATSPAIWQRFERRFGVEIVETYGQTEMVALWLMPPPAGARVGTVGQPPEGRFDLEIRDERGQALAAGERGEIAIKPRDPAHMARGYWRDPVATAAAFHADGWYLTADLGTRDVDGYVRYIGRMKDCIRRRGENISAYEIEVVVNQHPAVAECAAVGVPSAIGEEDVKLCVVPRPGAVLEPRDLLAFCRRELADFMVPRFIQIRGSLPKTATQRVQKPVLREEGTAGCWEAGRARE